MPVPAARQVLSPQNPTTAVELEECVRLISIDRPGSSQPAQSSYASSPAASGGTGAATAPATTSASHSNKVYFDLTVNDGRPSYLPNVVSWN